MDTNVFLEVPKLLLRKTIRRSGYSSIYVMVYTTALPHLLIKVNIMHDFLIKMVVLLSTKYSLTQVKLYRGTIPEIRN